MTQKERADLRLNCLYAAITSTGGRDSSVSIEGKQERMTTEGLLVEAKKISEWVIPKEEEPV
jgi:hypothetical protein